MDLTNFLKRREKQLGITHKKAMTELEKLQVRNNTNLAHHLNIRRKQLGKSYIDLAFESGLFSDVFSKLEKGKITPNNKMLGYVGSVYQIPKESLLNDIKNDLIEDLVKVYRLYKMIFLKDFGDEIFKRLKKAYL